MWSAVKVLVAVSTVSMFMACPGQPGPDGGMGGGTGGGEMGGGMGGGGGGDAGVQRDLDVVVVRLNTDGTVDQTFGTAGMARLDLGQATGGARDTLYGFDKDSSGRLVLFGSTKADGRNDADRFVARLTTAGALDTTFATNGVFRLDYGNASDAPRHGFVQADGKIFSAGYAGASTGVTLSDGGVQVANRPVLLRLNSDGAPDSTFGDGGVVAAAKFTSSVPGMQWGMAEAYGAARQSNGDYVTTGYGRVASSGTVDVVSFRFRETGAEDQSWGTNGSFILNLTGGDERGRHLVSLSDDRIVIVGSATPLTSNIDAMVGGIL